MKMKMKKENERYVRKMPHEIHVNVDEREEK